jgi:hypothetical protein
LQVWKGNIWDLSKYDSPTYREMLSEKAKKQWEDGILKGTECSEAQKKSYQ